MNRPMVPALILTLGIGHGAAAAAAADAPPPTRAQVEADWLLQDARRALPPRGAAPATTAQDAAGGVDGRVTGGWGFHTANERDPWWQVDLEQVRPIGRVVVYNRCDAMAGRNAFVEVLVSDDGRAFRRVYRHDGTVFHGARDGPPLTVRLERTRARFVRLALRGESYFHLDEVEVHEPGPDANVARGRPATQSSVSPWSVAHAAEAPAAVREGQIAVVVERGLKLAASQRRLGVDVASQVVELQRAADAARALSPEAPEADRRALYFRARHAVRALALGNPLLNFDRLLFVKRSPGTFPHMSDQHYGWWSRPGGGLHVLEGLRSGTPRVRCLTADLPPGSVAGPDLSHDGRKVVFAYCRYHPEVAGRDKLDKASLPEDAFYHVFEANVDGTGRRRLTRGRYDDFDPRYLPSGDIAFLSTRKGQALQNSAAASDATRTVDLPDSYVRCGGDSFRPVPVFTLHAMAPDGARVWPLSSFENFEWTPSVAADGRLLFTRWDYIDRFNGHFFSLWSANPDGTNPQLVYGNYTVRPQVVCEARSIPGSSKLVFTAGAHHSITGGSLCLLDRGRRDRGRRPADPAHPRGRLPRDGRSAGPLLREPVAAVGGVFPRRLVAPPPAAAQPGRRPPQPARRDGDLPARRLRQPGVAVPRPVDLEHAPDPARAAADTPAPGASGGRRRRGGAPCSSRTCIAASTACRAAR